MAKSKQEIIGDIKKYVVNNGGRYPDWYVGITSDPRRRLFNDHNVDEQSDEWIYRQASSADVAREIEDHFIDGHGMQGGTGGGDESSKSVYSYKVRPHTRE